MKEMLGPPAYKPLYDVIRINKIKPPNLDTDVYKEYLLAKKKFEEDLENKNVKIIIYEHVDDRCGKDENVSESDSSEMADQNLKKVRQKKNTKNVNEGEESAHVIQTDETKKGRSKKRKEKKKAEKAEKVEKAEKAEKVEKAEKAEKVENAEKAEETTETKADAREDEKINSDIVVKTKSTKIIGTLKILYNFYVNLYDKIKEDVENINNNTEHNKINLFRDVNLYSNYISMFDIINICEDLNIIKTFLNSKKECELIWILTVNYFDKVDESVFEKYKYKIDVNYEKQEPKRVQECPEKGIKNDVETSENNDTENRSTKNGSKLGEHKREDTFQETINEKNDSNSKKLSKDGEPVSEKCKNCEKTNGKWCNIDINRREKIKEYIYENCSEKVNALMFRKVNFFVFVYIMIYIIKTSTRKIKAIKDDIKKIKSFFFFLNIYEKKKTIETLNNLYTDKYLNFYQNYRSIEEIENYRKRKIFRHKFSFYDINKILGNKNAEFGNLKTDMNQKKVEVAKVEPVENFEKNIESENGFSEENLLLTLKENQTDVLKMDNKCDEENDQSCQKEKVTQDDRYKDTHIIETPELCNDMYIMNKQGNNCVNEENRDIKENRILNSYVFDYIFKNYCYKKKYWNVGESSSIDFGIIKKENNNKKYKINIYNYSKYNIIVEVEVDKELPISVMFKDKLFCVSSKYTIYLELHNSISGEKFGFVNVKLNYKNINKEHDYINIPVYIFIQD
ncbi:conserved Plasmodium protein, unknown function [Plasmodium chabaudi adami]|uniref:Uncharacterized protein n=1 Tax=Plasmodium chabaudi adami TaxID=5826 RepID=A0A1C6XMJ1_PLACE|nr:conserved Plasmodium protein, unknown function [Plasmodium chabaudi adami]